MVGWDRSREGCSCEEEAKKGRRIGGDGEDGMRLSSRARGERGGSEAALGRRMGVGAARRGPGGRDMGGIHPSELLWEVR